VPLTATNSGWVIPISYFENFFIGGVFYDTHLHCAQAGKWQRNAHTLAWFWHW
jgi:hypothetical protein